MECQLRWVKVSLAPLLSRFSILWVEQTMTIFYKKALSALPMSLGKMLASSCNGAPIISLSSWLIQLLTTSHRQSGSGQTGLAALFDIIALVLRPGRSESASLFIGDLVLHVFRRAGDAILPILPELLQALLLRLTTAKTSTFTQSLILPFAYLMHNQTDTVLDLLENVNIEGKTGIEILLPAWLENIDSILGFWNIRISTVALSKLLLSNRPSLNSLTVKGDLIVNQANSGGAYR